MDFIRQAPSFSQAQADYRAFLDKTIVGLPQDTHRLIALAANSLTGFVLEQGKDQGGSLPQSALINKTWQLDALASKRFEALKRNTFKIDKLLAGLIFMEYLLEHSGHDHVEVTRVELPTGLIVEYYQDRIADPVPSPCER